MGRKTRAAILVEQMAPLVIDEVEIPELGFGQVLVKVGHSGVCGKQIDEVLGKRPDPYIPHLLGHEGAGVVEEVGPGVQKVKPGDSVVLHWVKGSGIDSQTPKFSWNGSRVNAGNVTVFSDLTVVSENRVTPINPGIPTDEAALLGCAVTTGMGIVNNNANLRPGQSIVVFGVGGIGMNVIQAAALVTANPIIAIDIHDRKLKWASAFGATHTLNGGLQDPVAFLNDLTGGKGVDAAVDTVGAPDVRTMAYNVTSNTGVTVFAGVPYAKDRMTIDSFPLHFGRRVVGSHGGDTRPDVDIPTCARLYKLGKIKLKEQITHTFPLDQVNEAIDLVRRGGVGRCVLSMDNAPKRVSS